MLTGDNGLLNQAGKAKEITGIAEIKEAIDLAVQSAFALDPLGDLTTENLETTLAQNMPTDYELSGDEISGWTVDVPSIDKTYEINNSGNVGEYVPPPTIAELKDSGETVAENTKITDDNGDTMTIPGEFKIASDSATDIDEGVVVEAPDGSQFVWVPVPNAIWDESTTITSGSYTPMAVLQSGSSTNYMGCLYTFSGTTATYQSGYVLGTTSYREPSLVTGNSADTYAVLDSAKGSSYDADNSYYETILSHKSAEEFGKIMQEDFNAMVESVEKYGGFFVGRYESSKSGSTVASVSGVTPMSAASSSGNMWYGMYKLEKEYASSLTSVSSSMIWGSQYDAMLNWALTGDDKAKVSETTNGNHSNSVVNTGATATDVINNIYDLAGNLWEWTLEAFNTGHRVIRGSNCTNKLLPSHRGFNYTPSGAEDYNGSRLTLYIK